MFVRRSPFRETPAAAITPAMVETWYAGRVEAVEANQRARAKGEPFPEPTNKATTLNQLTAEYKHLRTLMAFAESRGLRRPDTNPCQIEGAQTYRAKQPPAPTVAEFWRIIEATPDPMHRAAFALQAAIAIRKGELAGLQRRDLTIEHDPDGTAWLRVRIERAIHWGKAGAWDIGTPKTEGSEREQYAEPEFAAVFLEWFAQQPQIGPESFVFTRSNGKPLGRNTLRRAWESACALAGGHWRMHSSRATVLTAFRERGADFRQIQARGGHSTVQAALRYQQPATLESQKKLLKPR
ncbi:MAG TPA: site-specific integrase [Microbacteriaceae bacterium]|nr:site-specific integrase [Microbacteriaceae bacterium]